MAHKIILVTLVSTSLIDDGRGLRLTIREEPPVITCLALLQMLVH